MRFLAHLFFLSLLIACALSENRPDPATALSTNSGIFTKAQANEGATSYLIHCAVCHGNDLRGTEGGVPLVGDRFIGKWLNQSLEGLFNTTKSTMPKSNPGGLTDSIYASLLAFILQSNNFPNGDSMFLQDKNFLKNIVMESPPVPTRVSMQFNPVAIEKKPVTIESEWIQHRGDFASTNYSSLDQINSDNVKNLRIKWRWKSDNFGRRPEYYYKVTPLMVKGILYTTAGLSRTVVAIDPENGETLWSYRHEEIDRLSYVPRQNSGRGVAYWPAPDGKDRVIFITAGFQLIALDAKNGQLITNFGNHGVVDLKREIVANEDPVKATIGSTSPPIIVNNVIVVGSSFPVGLAPASRRQIRGDILGYDVISGKRMWTFHTIPQPGEPGHDTWENGSWEYTGNVGAWSPLTADTTLGYVYLPLEAPTGDFYGGHRPGDNLYSGSLVCLDAKTGKKIWHYQLVHHDIWDYDLPAPPVLADINVDGKLIPAVVQVTKQAFAFVFNRETGEPVWPIEERIVPQSEVEGEQTAPTQPFPTKPAPFDRQGYHDSILIDFTPEIRQEALAIVSKYTKGSIYTPVTIYNPPDHLGSLMLPDAVGGANWQGAVLDKETGILYVSSSTVLRPMSLEPGRDENTDMDYVAYLGTSRIGPFGLPLVKPPYGRITAIDLNSGEHVWSVPNADTPEWIKNNPALKGITIPRTGLPDRVGMLVTKTLLFAGEGSGLYVSDGGGGNKFRAYDKATGAIVSEIVLPANQCGIPMTYSINGKQYIVVAVGAVGHPGEIVALGL